jgi:hypothetical protein
MAMSHRLIRPWEVVESNWYGVCLEYEVRSGLLSFKPKRQDFHTILICQLWSVQDHTRVDRLIPVKYTYFINLKLFKL